MDYYHLHKATTRLYVDMRLTLISTPLILLTARVYVAHEHTSPQLRLIAALLWLLSSPLLVQSYQNFH
jgi:hypothetical protein